MKLISNDSKIVAECFLNFIHGVINCVQNAFTSAVIQKSWFDYKNISIKKIWRRIGPKIDPCGIPAIISDHEL